MRDALPDLLHGRLSALDTATMKAHVESCANCRADLALLEKIRGARLMPTINEERIASSIAPYGGSPTPAARHERASLLTRLGSLRIAAGAVLVAAAGWLLATTGSQTELPTSSSPSAAVTSPAAEARAASPSGVLPASRPALYESMGEHKVASLSLVGGTDDLNDSDLEQLVLDLETIEAVPSAEPQSVTLTVDNMGNDQ